MNKQGCQQCSIENSEYLGDEDDGTPVYKCKTCGQVSIGTKCKHFDDGGEF